MIITRGIFKDVTISDYSHFVLLTSTVVLNILNGKDSPPQHSNYPTQNFNSAKIEKPWLREFIDNPVSQMLHTLSDFFGIKRLSEWYKSMIIKSGPNTWRILASLKSKIGLELGCHNLGKEWIIGYWSELEYQSPMGT